MTNIKCKNGQENKENKSEIDFIGTLRPLQIIFMIWGLFFKLSFMIFPLQGLGFLS